MAVWMIFTGLRIFLSATTVCPPCWGGSWYNDHCDILAHREWTSEVPYIVALRTSTSERTLREANLYARDHVQFFTSMPTKAGMMFRFPCFTECRGGSFIFGMFLSVTQWSDRCVPWQIFFVGVFVWALAPFVCLVCCFS